MKKSTLYYEEIKEDIAGKYVGDDYLFSKNGGGKDTTDQ